MIDLILTIGIPAIGIIVLTVGIIKRNKVAIIIGGIVIAICLFIVIAVSTITRIPG